MHTRFRQPEVGSFPELVAHLNRLVQTSDLPAVYLYLVTDVPAADAGLGTVLSRMVDAEVTDELSADLQNRDETTQEGANGDYVLPPESYDLIDFEQERFRKRQRLIDLYNGRDLSYFVDIPRMPSHAYMIGEGILSIALVQWVCASFDPQPWKDTTPTAPNINTPPHAADYPRFRISNIL